MANGNTHSVASVAAGVGLGIACYVIWRDIEYSAAISLGCFAQVFISPDRDVDGGTVSERYLRKISWILSLWWKLVWRPYSISMKHRGKSHAIYGTIGRLLYLMFPISIFAIKDSRCDNAMKLVIIALASQVFVMPLWGIIGIISFPYMNISNLALFVLGVFLSDIIHIIFDMKL